MKNSYTSLTADQVKAIAGILGPEFNAMEVGNLLAALDSLAASGGSAATATVRGTVLRAASVGTVTSANAGGTYTAAEQTLINELKTDLNALIASLQAAGVIA